MPLPFELAELTFSPLTDDCPREAFSCGDETVDKWFHQHACKRHNGRQCRVMLFNRPGDDVPVGFFALGMKSVKYAHVSSAAADKLFVRFSDQFPVIELQWIAVRNEFRRNGIGRFVMAVILDEFRYAVDTYGAQALVLEAIDQPTEDFYFSLGFRRYGPPVFQRRMLIGARTVVAAQEQAG